MELTVCQDTPNSAAIAEMVRSIINRRNTYRAHRRVVEARLPRSWLNTNRPHSGSCTGSGERRPAAPAGSCDRQVGQWPGDGVTVAALLAAVRAARIPRHRRAENCRRVVIDRGVGDRHPQLDGAHDRVGNNRRRAGSSLRQGSPRSGRRVSVGTCIVTTEAPPHRNDTNPTPGYRRPALHPHLRRAP